MALTKRTYVDGQTIITAANLNDIQDHIITVENNYVPKTRTVAGKALSSNITLAASDVGAVPTSRTINAKALTGNITLSAADVGAVPVSRTVNGKALSSNITLNAADVSAVPTTRKVNNKALSSDITLASSDIGDDSGAGGSTVKASLAALKSSLDAIDGLNVKQVLGSSDDLNTLYGTSATGVYYIDTGVQNSPVAYRPMICIGNGNDGFQFIYGANLLLVRMRTNNTWSSWSSISQSMIAAYTETSMTATRAYSTNDAIAVNGVLYSATTSIASGTALTVDTNVRRLIIGQDMRPTPVTSKFTDQYPDEGQSAYTANDISMVHNVVSFRFRKYGQNAKAGNGIVATVPLAFRPKQTQYVWGTLDRTDTGAASSMAIFSITSTGNVQYYATSQSIVTGYTIVGTYAI